MKCEVLRDPTYIYFNKITEILIDKIDDYRHHDSPNCLVRADNGKEYLVHANGTKVGDFIQYDIITDGYKTITLEDILKNPKLTIVEE